MGTFRIELRKDSLARRQAFALAIGTEDKFIPLLRNETPLKLVVATPQTRHILAASW
jgi:hypothetical protein